MKNKRLVSDWWSVFRFTFKQGTSAKKFKGVVIAVFLLLFAGGIACNMILAYSQKGDKEVSSIKQVYLVNESGLDSLNVDGFLAEHKEKYPDVSFTNTKDTVNQVLESMKKDSSNDVSKQLIVELKKEDQKYLVQAVLPHDSEISEEDAEQFSKEFTSVVEQSKLLSLNIPVESIVVGMSDISVRTITAGNEKQSMGEELTKMLLPMAIIFLMYFMNLVYGQSMGNVVSIEKTSKLMEYVLTLTNPYSLIFGKIVATASIAIIQMISWIGAFVGGFYLGDVLAKEMIYSEYHNVVFEVMKLLQGQEGSTAFSVGAIILAIIAICLSFILYCMLAGMVASFASKAEDLAQTMGFYQIIMIIAFFASYMLPLKEKPWINTIIRAVPFTSAYILPGDILVGNITVLEGVMYLAIQIVFLAVMVFVTGKVYKRQLFNRGKVRKFGFLRRS